MQTVNKLYFLSVFSLFWFAQLNFLPKGLTSWCSLFFLFFLFYLFLIHQFFVGHFRHIRLARSDLQHFVNVRPQILRCLISEGREAQPTYISIVIFQCNLANFVCVLHIPGAQNDQMTRGLIGVRNFCGIMCGLSLWLYSLSAFYLVYSHLPSDSLCRISLFDDLGMRLINQLSLKMDQWKDTPTWFLQVLFCFFPIWKKRVLWWVNRTGLV